MERKTLETLSQKDYELLDSGIQEKLERYGSIVLARPDPQALWPKQLSNEVWQKADGQFVTLKTQGSARGRQGEWKVPKDFPSQWPIELGGLSFYIRATSFKHTGLFPEQLSNWDWIQKKLHKSLLLQRVERDSLAKTFVPRVLNLFAYTGGATLAAAQAGAEVTHVDASKVAVAWAKENAVLSKLEDTPIRWIIEDALLFVKREIKRGKKYDAIIMDPPSFGHGPKDEVWKIEEDLLHLLQLCKELLSEKPLFIIISSYAAGYSPLALGYNLEQFAQKWGGEVACGDLTIAESNTTRLLPCGIFGRWSK